MADTISIKFLGINETRGELARIDRAADRATMWALRTCGRTIKSAARKGAPVYQGPPRDWWLKKARMGPVIKGELKKSIAPSRRLKRVAGAYQLAVGPRGGHVHIYAAKQEKHHAYMGPAVQVGAAAMPAIAEGAWARAIKSKR